MLHNLKDLHDYTIQATDGDIGNVKDFYFDDDTWVIRYFVVDTGAWLSGRKVLISPMAVGHPNWPERQLPVSITKDQVWGSPNVDTEKSVSRQHEIRLLGFYNFPYYWGAAGLWGGSASPGITLAGAGLNAEYRSVDSVDFPAATFEAGHDTHDDPHLRSCKAVTGYHVAASDGDIGYVCGMLVDERTWTIRYLIVDTSNWWRGHQVLIAPQWIVGVSWTGNTATLDLTRRAIHDALPYDPTAPIGREHEAGIYGLKGYWVDEGAAESVIEETDVSQRQSGLNRYHRASAS